MKESQLLKQLELLRKELKTQGLVKEGYEPLICTDDALKEMALKKPIKIGDFSAISGLENNFTTNYAGQFLKVIHTYKQQNNKTVKVSKNAYQVLHKYKDRLTDISRSNPNLYMGRIEKNKHFDLAQIDAKELINFLVDPKLKTYKISENDTYAKDLTTLYREVNKTYKETGSYNLYITFPYVEGIIKKMMFAIKAPLLYIPVKLERNRKEFILRKDEEKDMVYNRDLLLTTSNLDKMSLDIDTTFHGPLTLKSLHEDIIPFYQRQGIQIKTDNHDIELFENELKEDFVKRSHDGFIIKNFITLGKYQLYSSMIQKDMALIMSNHKYNDLLEGLIDEKNLEAQEASANFNKPQEINERNISYINPLNDSQEKVIELLNNHKKIVVWGPPGTGKSQTITSLIASSILKGENVLVISEKKVALDVIYSRLKQASKFALVLDDAENKHAFYLKLGQILDAKAPIRTINNDVFTNEEAIVSSLKELDKSLKLLYGKQNKYDTSDLFSRYIKDKDVLLDFTPLKVHAIFKKHFKELSFEKLSELEKTFDKDQVLETHLGYAKMLTTYPILSQIGHIINRSQRLKLEVLTNDFNAVNEKYKKAGYFKKKSIIKAFTLEHSEALSFLSDKERIVKNYVQLLFKDQTLHNYIQLEAIKLNTYQLNYQALNQESKRFIMMLLSEPEFMKVNEIHKMRTYLFNAYYTGYLEDFIATNNHTLSAIDDYQTHLETLNHHLEEKMDITTESFAMELYRHALNLSNTKRIMDIKRILEHHQKPSIKAFIDLFEPEIMQNIKVFLATPEVLSAVMPLRQGMFDLVIFDEASQMYVEKGIPAIYRAKKVVIAGDPKQLRPSSLGMGRIDLDDELYEDESLKDISLDAKSLLDLARYKYHEVLLNYHYRSTYEELIAFSNQAFYDGKLMVSPNQHQSAKPPIEYIHVADGYIENKKNHHEALAVVELVKKIFRQRTNNESIGIITFNTTQRDLIENYIDDEIMKKSTYQRQFEKELNRMDDNEDKSLFVKNIENVQGDERDIIIFSMGYAKDKSGVLKRRFGWLNHEGGQNRLNVAITRAKQKIYFVSSLHPEEFKVDDLQSIGPKLLKDFMRYCYYISNGDTQMAQTILNHLHETEEKTLEQVNSNAISMIKKRLERYGYEVRENIGIGSYKIDLAIYDSASKTYKLGIICDLHDLSDLNARRQLLHQTRYLKSRNWKIYHIFSMNWYTNPNKELKNIRDLLK